MIQDRRLVRHIYLSISSLEDETEAADHVHSILVELIRQTFQSQSRKVANYEQTVMRADSR
jgi:hypothetical protein